MAACTDGFHPSRNNPDGPLGIELRGWVRGRMVGVSGFPIPKITSIGYKKVCGSGYILRRLTRTSGHCLRPWPALAP